ncbi:MAG: PEP-CTERM sorting domain-containing protein [Fimbriimonadaceae bacterium]|nr:PEP-CTERM sorting domain-containing protein [Fimbriimonadaceae bacterium]
MKTVRGAVVAAVSSAALCQIASAQAFLFNHIGDLGGDPNSLEYVANHGTWFGSVYTAENYFFEALDVSNPGGVNVLTDWWEVRGGTGPDNNIPWDGFSWELVVHSSREAAIANPREGDIAKYNLDSPTRVQLAKLDRYGVPLQLLHFSGLHIPLTGGWYGLRHPGYNNYGSGIMEGTFAQGLSSDTWIPSNAPATYARDHPEHQHDGYYNVAIQYAAVPEPASITILSFALVGLWRRRPSSHGQRAARAITQPM